METKEDLNLFTHLKPVTNTTCYRADEKSRPGMSNLLRTNIFSVHSCSFKDRSSYDILPGVITVSSYRNYWIYYVRAHSTKQIMFLKTAQASHKIWPHRKDKTEIYVLVS